MNVIEMNNLTKTYGSARGVSNITLNVPKGSVFGFLGPNGAGKTTTISLLINLLRPTSGHITILGKNALTEGDSIRRDIGYLSSDQEMDGNLTGQQQLEYFGNLKGSFDKQYVQELAGRLDCNLSRKQKTLSRGNRQKVGLISALMHKPKLLILDEPTSGLDPLMQAEFNRIIREHKSAGRTAFISSHVLSEVQEICDEVAFIREGTLSAQKNIKDLGTLGHKIVTIRTKDTKFIAKLKKLADVSELGGTDDSYRFIYAGKPRPLLKLLSSAEITDVQIADEDLESTFMKYYEGAGNAE